MEDIYTLKDKQKYIYNSIESNNSEKMSGEVMNCIKYNNVDFTTNNNGFFINLSLINSSVIDEIYKIVHSYSSDTLGELLFSSVSSHKVMKSEGKDDFKPTSDNLRPTLLGTYILHISMDNLTL